MKKKVMTGAIAPREPRPTQAGLSREPYGLIRTTTLTALKMLKEPSNTVAIHRQVEDMLGKTVSRSSVKNALLDMSRNAGSPVERVGRGTYWIVG